MTESRADRLNRRLVSLSERAARVEQHPNASPETREEMQRVRGILEQMLARRGARAEANAAGDSDER